MSSSPCHSHHAVLLCSSMNIITNESHEKQNNLFRSIYFQNHLKVNYEKPTQACLVHKQMNENKRLKKKVIIASESKLVLISENRSRGTSTDSNVDYCYCVREFVEMKCANSVISAKRSPKILCI